MKKSELFSLIKSLTRAEKRYFKVFAAQTGGSSNYLRLFDAMDGQAEFDEAAIRQKFEGERFLNQLHVTKNYLRQLLLKSLRNFHGSISKDAELKNALRNIEILFNKELYLHCQTELVRAERIARTFELTTGLVEVIGWKRKLEQAQRPRNYPGISQILDEQKAALATLENTHDYWRMAVEMSSKSVDPSEVKNALPPLLANDGLAQTLEAKVLYFNMLYVYHLQNDQGEAAPAALEELVGRLEKMPGRTRHDPGLYLSTVNNLLSYFVFNKDFGKALALLRRSRHFVDGFKLKSEKRSLLKQVLRSCSIELEIYRTTGELEANAKFIAEMEGFVARHRQKMPAEYRLSFWFQFGYIAFMRRDYDRALHWVNLLLDTRLKTTRPRLQVQARLLNLMVHFEKRNLFVLRYFVDSARRFLKKQKTVEPHETILLQFFSKIGKNPELDWKTAFQELEKKLYPTDREPLVPDHAGGYMDYRKWIRERD